MTLILSLLAIAPSRTLIVGGGPNSQNNQIAIESNVQYCYRSLPKSAPCRILFADGDRTSNTVRFTPAGEQPGGLRDLYKRPELPRLDGASSLDNVNREIAALASTGTTPVLLYFTGHGNIPKAPAAPLSYFSLWSFEQYSAIDMAQSIAAFGKDVPVVAIMVQCHSGGFAKSMFRNGDPTQPPIDNRFCGFYASVESRSAAGCTSSINTKEYRDFTTYFLAALTGTGRNGERTTGMDYDKNGVVGMNEAFCWTLIMDESIDTPICTSDEFVRRKVDMSEDEVFATSYSKVLSWASPAQKAALEALSAEAKLSGEGRLATAIETYPRLTGRDSMETIKGFRFVRLAKTVVLQNRMLKHPDLGLRRRFENLVKDEAANPFKA
jgi:hypothetical protein